ncbi:MAG: tRNA pseudouridine(55) synthase TruB [Myxococcales bacterium]|nr:tRNA pseudouridine(55) synthase TruB [Myxococcales bacterium]MCB9693946.1 tRNA pseudouridine(55) synthase TruB [Alphaproteobacteria bacterium]
MRSAFLVIDKPAGITSHDVVAAVRAVTGAKKVGHTGTLDPFATGVLPLALGGATRLIQYLDESLKVYDATVALGSSTDTGDPTGQVLEEAPVPAVDASTVRAALDTFVGPRMQTPPAYSAVKKDGKPLYKYARAGEKVEVPARPITIHALDLTELTATHLRVRIECSRGTYARVLAEEIAEALGTKGHLSALARLQSGPFVIERSLGFEELASIVSAEPDRTWEEVLLSKGRPKTEPRVRWKRRDDVLAALEPRFLKPLQCLSHLPLVDVDQEEARRVLSGWVPPRVPPGVAEGAKYLLAEGDRVLAIAETTATDPRSVRTF